MTTYAIGDVRDKFDLLLKLLDKIHFDKQQDTLWFTGNLIHLDNNPLSVIRFIKELGKAAVAVLGDKDIELLSIAEDCAPTSNHNNIEQIRNESDFLDLLKWLRQRPLMHYDAKLNFAIVHAGIPAEWTLSQARTFAIEVESALSFGNHRAFLEIINSKTPPRRWNAKLHGWKRLHFITNAFTKIQCCNAKGYMDFGIQVAGSTTDDQYLPWYHIADRATAATQIVFSSIRPAEEQQYTNVFPLHYADSQSLTALKLGPSPETITVTRQ